LVWKSLSMLTMQDALHTLTQYWENHGCLTVQPANTEVGAGTLNPATALRVLGPEPWRAAYVEPSVRPDDSRYGDNPNRIATHTQFQVIVKPDPGDTQELYLGSLRALGIDTDAHDIRFVEDNWASPALGAWGLGWEVWLDGLEITQFTYFQQSGGVTLDPVSVEITYGIERILMALQGVDHFSKIAYTENLSYGEVHGQAEYEWSRYYLDDADLDTNTALFDRYEAEARRLVEARLPIPAHAYVLKCSHTFNVLDSRGAISPTERARAFARMRGLAHEVAKLWIARREEQGHPLGVTSPPSAPVPAQTPNAPTEPATLLLEIGTEELPASEVTRAQHSVAGTLRSCLGHSRLAHGDIATYASPRRIVALVHDVAPRETDVDQVVRGPRLSAAYDPTGAPTKAAEGFARGQGVPVETLVRLGADGEPVDTDNPAAMYVGARKHVPGSDALTVLASVIGRAVTGLRAEKNMRWNAPGLSFSRPIRWIVALLGDAVVPCSVSNLTAGRITQLHRNRPAAELTIRGADGYLELLAEHDIVVDAVRRHDQIVRTADTLAGSLGGRIDTGAEAGLLDEITHLVEQPWPLLGSFDRRYLELPADVLTTVMRKHQRYLPVRSNNGALLPHFVAVGNGRHDDDVVRAGNEAVLRARYEDAAFFFNADLRRSLSEMAGKLTSLTFAEHLGSMADRAKRIAVLAGELADLAGDAVSPADSVTLRRAGELAKFDLGSQLVTELSSLAGIMAREYALRAGETTEVATALAEMELPRSGGGSLPTTVPGALLALADRLDLLAGLFAIGATPTGSSDPFGMRRAALGVVGILIAYPALHEITVSAGLRLAAARQPVAVSGAALAEAAEFVNRRLRQQLLDTGHDHSCVAAVAPRSDSPAAAVAVLEQLDKHRGSEEFAAVVAAMQRVRRIVPAGTPAGYDIPALREPAELALHEAVAKAGSQLRGAPGRDLVTFLGVAGTLTAPIETFFADVLVMAEDRELRAARMGLLATIGELGDRVLNFSAL
jgi:glycyl-tRNA synthetase